MTDPHVLFSRQLIEQAKKERTEILREIEKSRDAIEQSREVIAQLDVTIAEMEGR